MKCEEIRNELSAYLDGELSGERMRVIDEHLRVCTGCRHAYEQLRKVGQMVRDAAGVEVSEGLALAIVKQASREEISPQIAWFPVTIRVALLAAIIINIGLFNLFRDYRFRTPAVSAYKPICVESVVEMEMEPAVEVSFSYPAEDTVEYFTPPRVVAMVEPTYPKDLLSKGIEGTVVLNIVVDEEGRVGEMRVVRSLAPEADSFAIASAGMLRFQPARIGAVAVEAVVVLNYLFKI
jgi:TonB family protein